MNEFNFRVANAAPRASGFEIGQNVGDTKTTYIYSYKTKYINGKSTGQKSNVDWDMESSIPSWVSVKYAFEGNDCKVTFTTLQENTGSSARTLFGTTMDSFFAADTNISGEYGSMADGTRYKNWIVNQNRNMINIYISPMYPGNYDMLSWSCLDKDGNAFAPNYNIPDNQYFTTKTTGLGSYTLKKISTPSVSSGTLILSSRFNPTKKYPLDLNFYWGAPT